MDETKVKDVFARHIVKLRKNRNMTQGEFADLLEVGVSTVSDWETGKKLPRAGAIEKLARTFNISKSSLFEEENEKNSNSLETESEQWLDIPIEDLAKHDLTYKGRKLNEEQKQQFIKIIQAAADMLK